MVSERNAETLGQAFALFVVLIFTTASFLPPLPTRIVPFWEEDTCMWFDGEIISKRIENEGLITADYIFVVDGTLDNYTDIQMEVHGDAFLYGVLPIGSYYNGTICDTIPLRDAIIEGVIVLLS
tara:strand:+ start:5691 stop:6062 length:372 start_codon:yes stop_codon:yes gene_type:complete